jgi:hypothetical protein
MSQIGHDPQCAQRIRLRAIVQMGEQLDQTALHQVAEEIAACCGHRRLKCFRLAYGWTVDEAVNQVHALCDALGIKRRGLVNRSWREWEAGTVPDRDYQDLLCRLFSTGPVQLGFAHDYSTRLLRATYSARPQVVPAYSGNDTQYDGISLEDLVMAAAHESAKFTQRAERTNVGPHTLEQLEADIRRIVTTYPNRPVPPTFMEVRELRNRAFELIEGRQYPEQSRQLYLITGVLCGILSNASFDLGHLPAAETQARTAFLCAELAGNNWLRSWIRGMQSLIAYWDDRPADAVALARAGWDFVPEAGTARVRLASIEARACARLKDEAGTDDALRRAEQAREQVTADDEIGGMLAFPEAKQTFYGATAHLWLGETARLRTAERLAAESVAWYDAAPPERRRIGEQCLARLDLAGARLAMGELEGAGTAVRQVLQAGSRRRTDSVVRRLRHIANQLDRPRYQDSSAALDLRDEIRAFCASPTMGELPR